MKGLSNPFHTLCGSIGPGCFLLHPPQGGPKSIVNRPEQRTSKITQSARRLTYPLTNPLSVPVLRVPPCFPEISQKRCTLIGQPPWHSIQKRHPYRFRAQIQYRFQIFPGKRFQVFHISVEWFPISFLPCNPHRKRGFNVFISIGLRDGPLPGQITLRKLHISTLKSPPGKTFIRRHKKSVQACCGAKGHRLLKLALRMGQKSLIEEDFPQFTPSIGFHIR